MKVLNFFGSLNCAKCAQPVYFDRLPFATVPVLATGRCVNQYCDQNGRVFTLEIPTIEVRPVPAD